VAQAASGCRWNETSAGDDQHQTEDDSRQQDTLASRKDGVTEAFTLSAVDVALTGARGVDIVPGNQVVIAGSQATFNCTSSPWNQAWYFYRLETQTRPCRIYTYRPHRINASSCQNLSRYIVTWHEDLLSLTISSTLTSDAGTYVCGDLLTPTSTCSAVLGVLSTYPTSH